LNSSFIVTLYKATKRANDGGPIGGPIR